MSDDTEAEKTSAEAARGQERELGKPRRKKRWKLARGVLLTVVLCGAVVAGALWYAVGREVDAPRWLRERIEQRLVQNMPGLEIDFGRVSLALQEDFLARIILWDVSVRTDEGVLVAQLGDVEGAIAPVSLLDREWELREARVSGGFLTVQRDAQGKLGLALGDAFSEGTEVPDLGRIITQVDALATDPRLARLDRFQAEGLTLRFEDLRAQRGWTADGGRVTLMREGQRLRLTGDVALLSGGDGVATVAVDTSSEIGDAGFDFAVQLTDLASRDIATQSPALAWLDALDAPISGSLAASLDGQGTLDEMRITLEIGAGVLQPTHNTKPLRFRSARTAFAYEPSVGILRFDEISVSSRLLRVHAAGVAQLDRAGRNTWPAGLTAQFTLADLSLAEGMVIDRPIALEGAQTSFRLGLDPFRVDLGNLTITDPDFPITARGTAFAAPEGWQLSLDAQVSETTAEQVADYWPSRLAPRTRSWVMTNLRGGTIRDVTFGLRGLAGEPRPDTFLDLGFEGATVGYAPGLPPVSAGAGRLSIYDRRLGLRLDAGQLDMGEAGVLRLDGSRFTIADLRGDPAVGALDLVAEGPLGAILAYVDNDQWQVLRKVGRDAGLATGRAAVTGRLLLPLVKGLTFDDVDLALSGDLSGVRSEGAVPGRVLTADALEVQLDGSAVEIAGQVDLAGVPARGRWRQPLGGGDAQVQADVTITPDSLQALGIDLPDGMVRGTGSGKLTIDLPRDAAPRFALDSDLAGLALAVPQIGWALGRETRGRFRVEGSLGSPVDIRSMSLEGAGLSAEGRVVLTQGGAFDRLELARLRVGDWMDVSGRLRGRGGAAPAVELASGRIDLRSGPFAASGGTGTGTATGAGGGQGGAPLSLTLDSLRVTDSIDLRRFRGNFDTTGGLSGRFDARLGGETPITGEVLPQNGGSAFRIRGEDAGDILRAAGLYKTVQDGTFRLDLAPVRGQPGSYDGALNIDGARLQKAPTVASLLDAISVVGILDQLNGPGIFFAEVDARFRLTPDRLIVSEASAVGPSMGISLDGFYDLASKRMDFQGVLSPIYVVNAIGRVFARRGEGLIGFNFNLSGTVDAPKVAVNPLSALTPGMFREIFRRPPPVLE